MFLLMSPILPEPEPELACLCPLGDGSSDLNKNSLSVKNKHIFENIW